MQKDTTRLELATLDLKSNTLPVKDIYHMTSRLGVK